MKIAVLDDWTGDAATSADWTRLSPDHQVDIFSDSVSGADLVHRLAPYEVICVMRERSLFSAEVLAQLPRLKAVITSGMRNAAIDLTACAERGIVVSGTPSPGHATAELAMTLIGALARNLVTDAMAMATGDWQTRSGRDLRGATLGILGLGRLGSAVARLGQAYGMNVIAWSQNLTPERAAEEDVTYRPKEAFFAESDFISIHLKLSPRVTGLVGADELRLMKADAAIINTSRAPIIDEDALITALTTGQIGAAAVDVYNEEPLPRDHRLRGVPNLLLTPHIGYVTRETMAVFYQESLAAVEAFLAGAPIRTLT